jgi:hypothetical protein
MSQLQKKFIKFGTGADEVNSRELPANFTPSNYTPAEIASEGNDKVSAHLNGIDSEIGTLSAGIITEDSFSFANNQSSATDVTGLSFGAGIRSFKAIVSVSVDATSDLFEEYTINGIQRTSDWSISQRSSGDDAGIFFSITSGGQVQYQSSNYTGFSSGTIKFKNITTTV